MKYFMTGRLAVYERMMQDNGEKYGGRFENDERAGKNHAVQKDRSAQRNAVKAGDTHARHQS